VFETSGKKRSKLRGKYQRNGKWMTGYQINLYRPNLNSGIRLAADQEKWTETGCSIVERNSTAHRRLAARRGDSFADVKQRVIPK
jgi:hypothetical protein